MRAQRIRSSVVTLALAGVLGWGSVAAPAPADEVLGNDGWSPGQPAAFQAGFVAGEIAAVRLVPSGPCPCPVEAVRLLFGGSTATQTLALHLWDDVGTTVPGAEIFSGDFALTGADASLQEIDLTGESVSVSGPFRVGIGFGHAGLPSVARDDDGITVARNFVFASGVGWLASSDLSITGDWIVRAVLAPEPLSAHLELAALGAIGLLASGLPRRRR